MSQTESSELDWLPNGRRLGGSRLPDRTYRIYTLHNAPEEQGLALICKELDKEAVNFCLNFTPAFVFIEREYLASHAAVRRMSIEADLNGRTKFYPNINQEILEIPDGTRIRVSKDSVKTENGTIWIKIIDSILRPTGEKFGYLFSNPCWRCDRPQRSYPKSVEDVVFNAMSRRPGEFCSTKPEVKYDHLGRLWTKNYPYPSEIFHWSRQNSNEFENALAKFLTTLNKLFRICDGTDACGNLRDTLEDYYRRVRLVSSTPSEALRPLKSKERKRIAEQSRLLIADVQLVNAPTATCFSTLQAAFDRVLGSKSGSTYDEIAVKIVAVSDLKRQVIDFCRSDSVELREMSPTRISLDMIK